MIYLLTDGFVQNTKDVFSSINKFKKTSRLFSIGIGNDFDEELVEGIAKHGNGVHTFVRDLDVMTENII